MTPKERQELLNRLIEDAALKYDKFTARQQRFALNVLERSRDALVDLILQYADDEGKVKKERARKLLNELDKIEIMIQENTLGATETALQRGVDRAMKDIENAYKGAGVPTVGLDFDTINADTMKYITQRFGEDGLVLSDRIWRFAGRQREALEGAIRAGILQGKCNS